MSDLSTQLAANLSAVQARIDLACARSGRRASEVRLVAVVKYAPWEIVRGLIRLGLRDLAENRPQQLLERAAQLDAELAAEGRSAAGGPTPAAEPAGVQWRLIGHLQRNKVRPVLAAVSRLDSIDSLRLLSRISSTAGELGVRPRVLLEVNVSGEPSKDGFSPHQLWEEWDQVIALPHVEIAGLMTMAPESDDPEEARPTFRGLRDLRDRLRERRAPQLQELSMGMSGDFETAIEEGATQIRIGSLLVRVSAP